jgi:hypothetical protein
VTKFDEKDVEVSVNMIDNFPAQVTEVNLDWLIVERIILSAMAAIDVNV